MADKASTVNQLLDAIEDLLIENRAYVAALKHAAPEIQKLADRLIATGKNDPQLRGVIHNKFAPFRDLSPEEALQEIVKRLTKNKDVN